MSITSFSAFLVRNSKGEITEDQIVNLLLVENTLKDDCVQLGELLVKNDIIDDEGFEYYLYLYETQNEKPN